jgi:aquaporin Z
VIGAVTAAGVLYVIASGKKGFSLSAGFASNGYGDHSPGDHSLLACFVAEIVLTMFFLLIVMGATDRRSPQGFGAIAIGLGLTLIHLVGIPVTNLSVNPARSTGPAIFVGGWAISQLWLFCVAPLIGGHSEAESTQHYLANVPKRVNLRSCEIVDVPVTSYRTNNGLERHSSVYRLL